MVDEFNAKNILKGDYDFDTNKYFFNADIIRIIIIIYIIISFIVNERLVKSKYDYQRYVKMFRTPKEIGDAIQLRTRQRATSARLSTPKYQRRKFGNSSFRDKYS